MGKKRCKQPQQQAVAKQTSSAPICGTIESQPDPVVEETPAPEYEVAFQVLEDVTDKGLFDVKVTATRRGDSTVVHKVSTVANGLCNRQAEEAGTVYDLDIELPTDVLYTLKTVNPSVTSQQKGGAPTKIILERAVFEIASADHHFAPGASDASENLEVKYKLNKIDNDPAEKLFICVRSDSHTPDLLYEEELSDKTSGTKTWRWNGKTNCKSGPLEKKFISPIYGPYKICLELRIGSQVKKSEESQKIQTSVLCREVKAEPLTWADAFKAVSKLARADFPAGGSDSEKTLWLQYKLNELGYPAGPLQSTPDVKVLMRALFKYTQYHPNLPHIADYDTINVAGPGGNGNWGWVSKWNTAFGSLSQIFAGTAPRAGADMLNFLKANGGQINDILEDAAALTDLATTSKIIIDHNFFYLNKDFLTDDAHVDYDKEFINGFCVPLSAKILLVSRKDLDGTGTGVKSVEALEGVMIKWSVLDPKEDVDLIPVSQGDVSLKSYSKQYVENLLATTALLPGSADSADDNCPVALGGKRNAAQHDDTPYFKLIKNLYDGQLAGTSFYSSANIDKTTVYGKPGTSGVFFESSSIGGDNYIIQASLSFDLISDAVQRKELVDAHRELTGLANSLGGNTVRLKSATDDPLTMQTGKLTVWRRHAILREVLWTDEQLTPINWTPIIENFKAAHIILVKPSLPAQNIASILSATAKNHIADTILNNPGSSNPLIAKEFTTRVANKAFSGNAMLPLPLKTLTELEASGTVAATPQLRYAAYTSYLNTLLKWPTYDTFKDVAIAVRKGFNELREGPGLIILRVSYLPRPDFSQLLPANVFSKVKTEAGRFKYDRPIALGLDAGVVVLDPSNTAILDEAYFVSHEIAHCLFSGHPFEPAAKHTHDLDDKNCMMYYGKNTGVGDVTGDRLGWGLKGIANPRYGLTIIIPRISGTNILEATLSGANFQAIGPSSAPIDGKTVEQFNIEGTIAELQKALDNVKFTRTKGSDKDQPVALRLRGSASGLMPAFSNEGLSLPLIRYIPIKEDRCQPFNDIRLKGIDVKKSKPAFCGKCITRFRGWKVSDNTAVPPATGIKPIPVNAQMHFLGYVVSTGGYKYQKPDGTEDLVIYNDIDKPHPSDPRRILGPMRFLHKHRLTWESSTGKLSDLAHIKTRELVEFNQPTQNPPFNKFADPDQKFAQEGDNGNSGRADDDHSVGMPALLCARAANGDPIPGSLIAIQHYQYSDDNGVTWKNIENAAFTLEKTVYKKGKNWVLKFRKANLFSENPVPFLFEAEYYIPAVPKLVPKIFKRSQIAKYQTYGLTTYLPAPGSPIRMGHATIFEGNDEEPEYLGSVYSTQTKVTKQYLISKHFMVS